MQDKLRVIIKSSINESRGLKEIHQIVRILRSKSAYKILDNSNAPDTTFQQGGCWIAADALSEYYNLPINVVYNKALKQVEHFMVGINSVYLDSEGIQSGHSMIKKIIEDKDLDFLESNLEIREYTEDLNTEDIVRDIIASKKLVELFNK